MNNSEKIPVIVELNFDYSSIYRELSKLDSRYFDSNGIKSNLNNLQILDAKIYKNSYIKNIMASNNVLTENYEIIAQTEYAPFIFLNVNKKEVEKLSKDKNVFSIGLFPDFIMEATTTNSATTAVSVNNNSTLATRVDLIKNAGLNGDGIRIGQIETSNPNISNSYLSGKTIFLRNNNCSNGVDSVNHATEVAGILIGSNGIAPSASLYSACFYGIQGSTVIISSFADSINWLIGENVDIINMSARVQSTFSYNTMDRWIDAITFMYDILFVKSSGNNSNANTVTSPGLSYNTVTVGSINYTGTNYLEAANGSRSSFSSYSTYSSGNNSNKPELVVPGEGINYTNEYGALSSGTSFSSPIIAGTAALLMQSTPSTRTNFQSLKAALFVTARAMTNYPKSIGSSDGFPVSYFHYNDEVGLGLLDGKAAYDLLRWGQFTNFTVNGGSSDSYTYYNTLSNGKNIRVAITWSKPNTATSYSSVNNNGTDRVADLDLHILGPSGQKIVISGSAFDNVEWVSFTTNLGYGSYRFKAVNYATFGNTVPTKVSMAWW